jgi:hypothetical protein
MGIAIWQVYVDLLLCVGPTENVCGKVQGMVIDDEVVRCVQEKIVLKNVIPV